MGGAEFTPGCSFDAALLAASGHDLVTLVPAAAAYETPTKVVARATDWFAALGARVEVVPVFRRAEAADAAAVDQLRRSRFVYLADGSAAHLRSVLKDTVLLEALVDAWRDGAVLAASGQAATALCDVMVDARGGAFTVGLGVLTGLTVIPHYDEWSKEKTHRTLAMAPSGLFVAGVDDRTALCRAVDGTWSADGAGRVDLHRDHQVVALAQLSSP